MRKCVNCENLSDEYPEICEKAPSNRPSRTHAWIPIPPEDNLVQLRLRDLQRMERDETPVRTVQPLQEDQSGENMMAKILREYHESGRPIVIPTSTVYVCAVCGVAMEDADLHQSWHEELNRALYGVGDES